MKHKGYNVIPAADVTSLWCLGEVGERWDVWGDSRGSSALWLLQGELQPRVMKTQGHGRINERPGGDCVLFSMSIYWLEVRSLI